MKKIILMSGCAILVGLTACDKNDYNYNQSYTVKSINVVTNLETGATTAADGAYFFQLYIDNDGQRGSVTTGGLMINNQNCDFITQEQQYATDLYNVYFQNVKSSNQQLSNSFILLTPYYYVPTQFGLISDYQPEGEVVIAQYTIDNKYRVSTFQPNTFYTGTTVTSYPFQGQTQTYETQDIKYLLSIDLKELTATVVMYDAKFSGVPQEPVKKRIDIPGLKVSFENGAVIAKGSNIVPLMLEGTQENGVMTPNDTYIINSIEFQTTTTYLTNCELKYTVAGIYSGDFSGSYSYDMFLPNLDFKEMN